MWILSANQTFYFLSIQERRGGSGMSERTKDYDMFKEIASQNTEAFRHHAAIMNELNKAGFKPNPVPQVDTTTERLIPKQMYRY